MDEPTIPDYQTRKQDPARESLEASYKVDRFEYNPELGLKGELKDIFGAIKMKLIEKDPANQEKLIEFFEALLGDRKRMSSFVFALNMACAENIENDTYKSEAEVIGEFAVNLAGDLYAEFSKKA